MPFETINYEEIIKENAKLPPADKKWDEFMENLRFSMAVMRPFTFCLYCDKRLGEHEPSELLICTDKAMIDHYHYANKHSESLSGRLVNRRFPNGFDKE